MKVSNYLDNHTKRILIIGLPGSGKSTLAAELAETMKLFWVDTENAASLFKKLSPKQQQNIELLSLKDSASYPIAADTLAVMFKTGKLHACDTHGKNNCPLCTKDANATWTDFDSSKLTSNDAVVIDTATQLSASILAHLMRLKPTDAKPERDDWGALRKHTEFFRSQFQAVDYNLIVISHVTEAELDNGLSKLVPNFGSAAMSASFAKSFDEVIYCDIRNKKHVAFSSSTALPSVVTRSRTDFKIEDLPVPSLLPLFKPQS